MNQYRPATPNEVAAGGADVQGVAATPGLRLMGFAARESAGAPAAASLTLHHGDAGADPLLATSGMAASGTDQQWFGPEGLACPDGIYVNRLAGETHLVLYTMTLPRNL